MGDAPALRRAHQGVVVGAAAAGAVGHDGDELGDGAGPVPVDLGNDGVGDVVADGVPFTEGDGGCAALPGRQ